MRSLSARRRRQRRRRRCGGRRRGWCRRWSGTRRGRRRGGWGGRRRRRGRRCAGSPPSDRQRAADAWPATRDQHSAAMDRIAASLHSFSPIASTTAVSCLRAPPRPRAWIGRAPPMLGRQRGRKAAQNALPRSAGSPAPPPAGIWASPRPDQRLLSAVCSPAARCKMRCK
jgi:hypothetical protein